MNTALCGGPWILAGQTLIVRKWRPDFDLMTEFIGKMALWVRIFGLPVKYFKDYTVAKIGKILGDVVKVDQLTLGQSRGKFARVCIEVDLNKPLCPFVEVESVAYNVVYEGISLICFECGCFGHSKDKCPTLHSSLSDSAQPQAPTATVIGDVNDSTENNMIDAQQVVDASHKLPLTPQSQNAIIKEAMGPWMLMSYKNKKRVGENGGSNKNATNGSRFAILQEEGGIDSVELEPTMNDTPTDNNPPIVKLWQSFQEKKKNSTLAAKTKSTTTSTTTLKNTNSPCKQSSFGHGNHKSVLKENSSSALHAKSSSRLPMKDVSNIGSSSGSKAAMQYQRKAKGLISSVTKQQPHVFKKLSFENVDANVLGNGISTIFGHCSPEETLVDSGKYLSKSEASENFVEQTFADISMLTNDDSLPSQVGEGMTDA
ncbi:uncharacterized protein LOC112167332 [Rosa chinensis]|uniref:uncharacterized protein LOC112167332 n=1 Tax=Rosa chinensis TaxID=74649 RepID=UPI000D090243|nr:uncharacterized protein LOC112167332 [Rosa chinensis]